MRLKTPTSFIAILICLLATTAVHAKPIHGPAADLWDRISAILEDHSRPASLTQEDLADFLAATDDPSSATVAAGAYGLAFAHDRASRRKLENLSQHSRERVADFAQFALLYRDCRNKSPEERLAIMKDALATSTRTFTRLLLANWLGSEFGESILPMFRVALPEEANRYVRAEYVYHLARSERLEDLEAAISQTGDPRVVFVPENIAYILSRITPGRASAPPVVLLKRAEKRVRMLRE